MTLPSDERRIRKLPVTTSEAERSSIDLAITLWQAKHGQSAAINENLRGSILAAICDVWREAEIRAIGGGNAKT